MGPRRGEDNTPVTVLESVRTLAEIRGLAIDEMTQTIRRNFRALFDL